MWTLELVIKYLILIWFSTNTVWQNNLYTNHFFNWKHHALFTVQSGKSMWTIVTANDRHFLSNIVGRSILAFANREYNLIYMTVTVEYWESKWGFLYYVMAVQTEMLAFTLCPRFIAHTVYSHNCIEWQNMPIQIRCNGLHLKRFFFPHSACQMTMSQMA